MACFLIPLLARSAAAYSAGTEPHARTAVILKAKGVMVGYEDGQMRWGNTLTRAEAIKIIVTGIGKGDQASSAAGGPSWFRDVSASHWASGYIAVGAELGIVKGHPDGTLSPEAPVTVAELSVMLSRMYVALRATPASPPAGVAVKPDWAATEILRWPGLVSALKLTADARSLDYPASRAEAATLVEDTMERAGLAFDLQGTLSAFDPASSTIKISPDQRTAPVTLPFSRSTVWLDGDNPVQGPGLVNRSIGVVISREGKLLLVVSIGPNETGRKDGEQ
ncbi:MAG: S-layer homology domain-containing protein [Bacillota bacterium]